MRTGFRGAGVVSMIFDPWRGDLSFVDVGGELRLRLEAAPVQHSGTGRIGDGVAAASAQDAGAVNTP